jgi:hypothetical protein
MRRHVTLQKQAADTMTTGTLFSKFMGDDEGAQINNRSLATSLVTLLNEDKGSRNDRAYRGRKQ